MACDTCNFLFFILGYFLPFYPPKSPKNQMSKKMSGDIIIWHSCTKNYDYMMYGFWDGARQTDGQTDRQKKWHIEVGAHLKTFV